ncbi:MAG TPA: sigma-70 family RNA polymerase sigma factor [Pirellulales bacterium]|jgi:RNA polymerase sigma-70 factor (ECF subfamily)|nr:sigma-70 family RNA polymerase sigma factor [Pirellulales bacterium]
MTTTNKNLIDCAVRPQPTENKAACPDDAEILARVQSGDEESCEALVRQHGGRMLAVARRLLRTEEDCADAVQDAFLAAFRSLDGFQGNSSLGTWLHRIVVNACLMKLRTQSRSREVQINGLLPTFDEFGHHADPERRPEDRTLARLAQAETRARVRTCIDRLPDPYREVLLLRDIEQLDTGQTARQLGIAPGAVKTRLHRARQALRTLLDPIVSGL